MDKKGVIELILRYLVLILLGLGNLAFFYIIFTPLTIYPVYYFLTKLFDPVFFISTAPIPAIYFKGYVAHIIPACVAGSAYYLLTILNLTAPMKILKRLGSLAFMFLLFLILNITRIVVFANLVPVGYNYFDLTHQLTWYFGSTLMVIIIWFTNVLIFRIKTIPIYTDIRTIYQEIRKPKENVI